MEPLSRRTTIKDFVLDVDGVMTDGGFYYDAQGKRLKKFGPDDSDALGQLKSKVNIHFISADRRGLEISKKRIEDDMGYELQLVEADSRLDWLSSRYQLDQTVFMADGFMDAPALKAAAIGICPANASAVAKSVANHITPSAGGNRAVSEACIFLSKYFGWGIEAFKDLD